MTIHLIDELDAAAADAMAEGRTPDPIGRVDLIGETALIHELAVEDPTAVMLLATALAADRPAVATRMVAVGAQGLASMGLGLDLAAIDERVAAVVDAATGQAEAALSRLLDEAAMTLTGQFDPDQRTSILARALADFTSWRDGFIARLDPTIEGSAATDLLGRIQQLVGPDGSLEQRLAAALDLEDDGSALARLRRAIETGFGDLRRELAAGRAAAEARDAEAERGTAHGLDFEDLVETHLRTWAAGRGGCMVERTSTQAGDLTAVAKVGDFVVTLADGRRIVVEAKRHAHIGLGGAGGILAELDAALDNRSAQMAVCIAGRDAFPGEVGRFGVYGNRILAVDEGEGTMVGIAMQWAAAGAGADAAGSELGGAADRVDRIRKAAEQLSGARRSITTIRASLDRLHDQLGGLRSNILDEVSDLDRIIAGSN